MLEHIQEVCFMSPPCIFFYFLLLLLLLKLAHFAIGGLIKVILFHLTLFAVSVVYENTFAQVIKQSTYKNTFIRFTEEKVDHRRAAMEKLQTYGGFRDSTYCPVYCSEVYILYFFFIEPQYSGIIVKEVAKRISQHSSYRRL